MYYTMKEISAEAVLQDKSADVKVYCDDALIMNGVMAFSSFKSFNKLLGELLRYFKRNKPLYLNQG